MSTGVVKYWKHEKGHGAISSDDLPDGQDAWLHFSALIGDRTVELWAGQRVTCDFVELQQDSFRYVARNVKPL